MPSRRRARSPRPKRSSRCLISPRGRTLPSLGHPEGTRLLLAVAVMLENGLLQLGVGGVECRREHRGALYGVLVHLQLHRAVEIPPVRLIRQNKRLDGDQVVVALSLPPQPVLGHHVDKAQVPLVFVHEEVGHVPELVVRGIEDASAAQVVIRACGMLMFLQPDDVHGHSSLFEPAFPGAGQSRTNIRPANGRYKSRSTNSLWRTRVLPSFTLPLLGRATRPARRRRVCSSDLLRFPGMLPNRHRKWHHLCRCPSPPNTPLISRRNHRRIIANSSVIHRYLFYWVVLEAEERSEITMVRRYRGRPRHRARDHHRNAIQAHRD